jgi:uncharacterized protein (DUF1501 family)
MAKHLVVIQLGGGIDGINLLSPRDAPSVARVQALRQGAPSNVLDYTDSITVPGQLTVGSPLITSINTSGISVGMLAYGTGIDAFRKLTVTNVNAGSNEITLSGNAYATGVPNISFKTATQLYKLNEVPDKGRNLAFHSQMSWLWDTFNVADTVPNLTKTKAAVFANIGVLRKPLNIVGGQLRTSGGAVAQPGVDIPSFLYSHNDQVSITQSNSPEGASEGWGGGVADHFLQSLPAVSKPLASISVSGLPVFSSGTETNTFTISTKGLMNKIPNYFGNFTSQTDPTTGTSLKSLYLQALVENTPNSDFDSATGQITQLMVDYQTILGNAMEITSSPTISYNLSGSLSASGKLFADNMRSIVRMQLANNPNRGGVATRSGNVVTIETEITNGVANRTAGQSTVTVTSANHRLFTSNTGTDISDSVIVLGSGLDTSPTTNGYKITLVPSDVNNKFTFTTSATTALVDVPVTIRLKHNLNTDNKVHIANTTNFDGVAAPEAGYQVTTIINNTSFTVITNASGAYAPTSKSLKFKLINLPKMVMYAESNGFSWDSHNEANHSQLAILNDVCQFYSSIIERIEDADTVTCLLTDFGRTLSTNLTGTDHGWGNNIFCFGKNVKGNKVYGDVMDYAEGGAHYISNSFMPTTSFNQYSATVAKWMGSTDVQVLELFPDLANWTLSERMLGFMY